MEADRVIDTTAPCSTIQVSEPSSKVTVRQECRMLRCRLEELTLELTQDCLNRCAYCSSLSGSIPTHPSLGVPLVRKVIDEAVDLGLRRLSISGGEPFLHGDLPGIIGAIRDSTLEEVVFFTSGVVRSQNDSPGPLPAELFAELCRVRGVRLVFNIQSSDAAIHDRIVGAKGRLATTLASMQAAIDSSMPVECHIVPNSLNVDTLVATAHMLIAMGVSRISFLRMVPQGNAVKNRSLLLDQCASRRLDQAISEMRPLAEEGGPVRFGVPFSGRCGRFSQCKAGVSKLIVRWDGAVFPCEAFKECGVSDLLLGRVGEQPLSSLLRKARENQTLIDLRERIDSSEPCPAQVLYRAMEYKEVM